VVCRSSCSTPGHCLVQEGGVAIALPAMGACCGKSSREGKKNGARTSLLEPDGPEEPEWKAGGRYRVARHNVALWRDPTLRTSAGELKFKDVVLLLCFRQEGGNLVGFVAPPAPDTAGWISLDPLSPGEVGPLIRRQLEGSWAMRARYAVKNPATLRKTKELTSEAICDTDVGTEVLVLELDINSGTNGKDSRLRALVKTDDDVIGWLSPETASGDRLLDPVDLHGPEVVEIHRKSLSGGNGGMARASIRSSRKSSNGGGKVSGGGLLATMPWETGGKYRVLERIAVRENPDLESAELGMISASSIVTVSDIQMTDCPNLGQCPCAFVTVDDGPEKGRHGWVRCAAKDGHDLVDTRDHLEFDKVMQKLRQSELQIGRPSLHQANGNGQDDEDDSDEDSDDETATSGSEEGFGNKEFEEKMEGVEASRDDRPVVERSNVEDKSYMPCCNCGASRAPANKV